MEVSAQEFDDHVYAHDGGLEARYHGVTYNFGPEVGGIVFRQYSDAPDCANLLSPDWVQAQEMGKLFDEALAYLRRKGVRRLQALGTSGEFEVVMELV